MSTMSASLGGRRTRAPLWLAIALAVLVFAFIASAVVSLSADPSPTGIRDPGPSVTYPAAHRGDFHEGYVRRGPIVDEGFRGGTVKQG
jgi:hypothetical protein